MHRGVATVMFRVIADGVAGLLSLDALYAAPLHSCKYRWLHAPATITPAILWRVLFCTRFVFGVVGHPHHGLNPPAALRSAPKIVLTRSVLCNAAPGPKS